MAVYEILITDVTNYGSLFCVAGVSADGSMIRPEPHTAQAANEASRFWSNADAGPGKFFAVGNVVRFEANQPPAAFPHPHATEDRLVIPGCQRQIVETLDYAAIPARAHPSVSPSIAQAFDEKVVLAPSRKAYVPKDTQGHSLGAIEIGTRHLQFHVNNYRPDRPKLRAYVEEGGSTFDLAVRRNHPAYGLAN